MLGRFLLTALLGCTLSALRHLQTLERSVTPASRSMELLRGWEIQSSCETKDPGEQIRRYGMRRRDATRPPFPTPWSALWWTTRLIRIPWRHKSEGFPGMNYSAATFLRIRICRRESVQMFVVVAKRICIARWVCEEKMSPFIFLASITGRTCGLTGRKLPTRRTSAGTYRIFEFDLTKYARPGAKKCDRLGNYGACEGGSGHHVGGLESCASG